MQLSFKCYLAITFLAALFVFVDAKATLSNSIDVQPKRFVLRPAKRPVGKAATVINRRSVGGKLANRRIIAASGMLEARSGLSWPLPIRVRAATPSDKDDDIEDNFDCEGYDDGNPKVTSSNYIFASTSPTSTITASARFGYDVPKSSNTASSSSASSSYVATPSCTSHHAVLPGEICLGIANYPENAGLTFAKILQLNPSVNSDCTNLYVGQILCTAA